MKKKYTPMTLTVEQFEPNEAVAGNCALSFLGTASCEDCCDVLDRYGFHDQHHSWNVYGKLTEAGEWADGAIGISVGDSAAYGRAGQYTSSCFTNSTRQIKNGDAVIQTSNVRKGYFDPVDEGQQVTFANGASMSDAGLIYNQNS